MTLTTQKEPDLWAVLNFIASVSRDLSNLSGRLGRIEAKLDDAYRFMATVSNLQEHLEVIAGKRDSLTHEGRASAIAVAEQRARYRSGTTCCP